MTGRDLMKFFYVGFAAFVLWIILQFHSGKKQTELFAQAIECINEQDYEVIINGIKIDAEKIYTEGFSTSIYYCTEIDNEKKIVYFELRNDELK